MITVKTKQELEKAMRQEVSEIKVVGSLAKTLAKKTEKKKAVSKVATGGAIIAGIFGIGCLIAAPFTGGISLLGEGMALSAVGAGAAGLTIGTVTLTTTELAILCGSVLGAIALKRGYNAKISYEKEGPVVVFYK